MAVAGKYDDLCTYVREQTGANAAIVVIVGGDKGSGFSVQTFEDVDLTDKLPEILRVMAAEIEEPLEIEHAAYRKRRPVCHSHGGSQLLPRDAGQTDRDRTGH